MKKLILIAITGVVFASCSKKTNVDEPADPTPPASVVGKVKTTTFDGEVRTYSYDNKARCVLIQKNTGVKTTYEYWPGKVTMRFYKSDGSLSYSRFIELNSMGRAARVTRDDDAAFEELIEYNADGTSKKSVTKQSGQTYTDDYFYTNGNCDSVRRSIDGTWHHSMVYSYTNMPNVLSNVTFGDDFFSKPNKNLRSSAFYRYANGVTTLPIESSYEFNVKGQVIKSTELYPGGAPEIGTYTYFE